MVKITQINVDWKDSFDAKEIKAAFKDVGGTQSIYDYDQSDVDSKVMFVSSIDLTPEQLDKLWSAGDLFTSDETFSGKDFDEVVKKIREYADKQNPENESLIDRTINKLLS
jgi:hypothetical protein